MPVSTDAASNHLEPFVNAREASKFVRFHPVTVQRLAREGLLPGHPVSDGLRRHWRFRLFDGLLGGIPEFKEKQDLIVVPDGKPHLLPFSALVNAGQYVLTSHLVTVVPSGTVLNMLRHRSDQMLREDLPYVGVAAWTSKAPQTTFLARISRAISGPERR